MDIAGFLDAIAAQSGGVLTVHWSIDYFAIIVGAITGALFACERKLDIIGTVFAGLATAYGGGLIRDVILQDHGIYFTQHPDLIVICIVLCVFVFYFRGLFKRLDRMVFFADTLSVALFALAGSSKAFAAGQGVVVSIILGAITAVGGGALRDICVGEVPSIFKQSNFYAVAGLGGSIVYVVLAQVGCPLVAAGMLCVATVVALRYVSVRFNLKTTQEADLAPVVTRAFARLRGKDEGVESGPASDSASDSASCSASVSNPDPDSDSGSVSASDSTSVSSSAFGHDPNLAHDSSSEVAPDLSSSERAH